MTYNTYDSERHEKAMLCVAKRLASFRLGLDADDPYAFNENERLMAGHIVGSLWAEGLLAGLYPQ
jgi:hypothetical protein